MALTVLNEWGLERGEDVGNIVYNLIETGYFGKNEGDSIEDFAGGYEFDELGFHLIVDVLDEDHRPKE